VKKSLVLLSVLVLAACASPDYEKYLTTQETISANRKAAANVQAIAMQKIAESSDSDVVKAVALMQMSMSSNQPSVQMVAPPQNPALEWFKAATPLLGTFINGRYTLKSQEISSDAQVEMYSTQIGAFRDIAVEGIRKEPLPVVVAPFGSEVLVAPE